MSDHAAALTLSLPYNGQTVTVELYQQNVVTDDFTVKSGQWETQPYTAGLYYRGIIPGVPHSLVAISFFDDEVIGVISHPQWGNLNLGKMALRGSVVEYTLYNANYLPPQPFADCVTREGGHSPNPPTAVPDVSGCVRIFFEADYALFQNKGSVSGTVNYVTAFFNAVSTIYAGELVTISMSQIYVWATQDAYSTTSSGDALDQFVAYRTNFDGDLAHLTALAGSGLGGVAYLDVLCSNGSNYGYSGINSTFQAYPTYSWTVNVVTHELGHNFSSNHTHWFGWPGGAIDNCGPTAGYPFETPPSCSSAPTPPLGGGTIMSYCHLIGTVGVNLANGFGPLPGNAIRAGTTSALSGSCIAASCPSVPCAAPTSLTITSITQSAASIAWNNVGGAGSYNLQYRVSPAGAWNTVVGASNPYALSGLAPSTIYEVQVQSVCGANSSAYFVGALFKTLASACAEPNTLTATTVSSNSVSLNWTEVGSATAWDIEYGLSGFALGSGTTIHLTSKPYTLMGLTGGMHYEFYVRATCGGSGNSAWVGPKAFFTPTQNDLASGAINIVVNAACPGTNVYTNEGATATGEFSPTTGSGGYWATAANNTVWFKFTAPASGSVKVTTDINPLGTLDDTQIALYNTPSPTSAINHLLVSNEDGGTLGNTYATLAYYSGLTSGAVYYIQVDGWSNDVGTFCLEVQETFDLPEPGSCTSFTQASVNGNTAPNKWFNIYTQPDIGNIGQPVAAIKSSANLGTVTVQEIRNPTVPTAPNGVKYMQRYYNFESSQNSGASKQVRLFFSDSEFADLKNATGLGSATAEDLNISHYDGTNENCTPVGNGSNTYTLLTNVTATEIGGSGYFYLTFTSPSFSEMGAVLGFASLPIELKAFTANTDGSANAIHWTTATEKDVDYFTVERSADGVQHWENVCGQKPASNVSGEKSYSCRDERPFAQTFYRLATQNLDGSVQRSNLISVERNVPEGIQSIAPNPARETIYVAYNSTREQIVRFRILGADGRLILEQPIELATGLNLLPFDVFGLPQGLYFCLTNGSDVLPFVKW
ncbi:MAG: fibronectin type III domain-containing protein [Saprospiraceae bacterium]